jgi:hypothetical protein
MKNIIVIIFLLLGLQSATALYAHAPSSPSINVSGSIVLENNEKGSRISDELKSDPDAGAFNKKKKFGLFNKLKQKLVRLSLKFIQNEGRDDRPYHWSAITAFVCAGLTLFTGGLLFLPAIIFGAIGVFKTGPKKEYKGLGMSIAGLGLGLLIGALFVLYIIYLARFY